MLTTKNSPAPDMAPFLRPSAHWEKIKVEKANEVQLNPET
jgi:hypothetical protein